MAVTVKNRINLTYAQMKEIVATFEGCEADHEDCVISIIELAEEPGIRVYDSEYTEEGPALIFE